MLFHVDFDERVDSLQFLSAIERCICLQHFEFIQRFNRPSLVGNNNCNLNLSMNSTIKHKISTICEANNRKMPRNDKTLYNQIDHQLIPYFPKRTETEDDLYEFQLLQQKSSLQPPKQKMEGLSSSEMKKNIELSIVLVTQNDELARKIEEIKKCMEEEELKAIIFKKKIEDNAKIIEELEAKKEKISQESEKIKTLNESSIPNKSLEMNSTVNTNAWLNEFLNKSQLQSLWTTKNKEQKMTDTKVKSYTIDLSTFMSSAKQKNEKINQKGKASCSKIEEDRPKSKNTTLKVSANRPPSNSTLKNDLNQKQRLLNKNLAQMRNIRKNKHNPQL